MYDYLVFNKFIAQDVLIVAYYFGVIVMPILLWYARSYIIKKVLFIQEIENFVGSYYSGLSGQDKRKVWLVAVVLFICMQLCWRMMFEMMIGYFDMHDYLYEISEGLKSIWKDINIYDKIELKFKESNYERFRNW